ncbi:hypothetical protein TorRG33x02_167560 [Trema orientale]|uniref:Uncharacterized protein n=1 Tax=Trema orientale TaxID=63057 RepID=A0A2P5EPD0_TREOI|nr:hypothetical protein TorRG33x02_167560 [Trema orientale]
METHMSNMGATIKNIEVQIGQLASSISAQQKGSFPANKEVNPREQCNAISLQSEERIEGTKPHNNEALTSIPIIHDQVEVKAKDEKNQEWSTKDAWKPNSITFPDNPPIIKPPLPFPQRFYKK